MSAQAPSARGPSVAAIAAVALAAVAAGAGGIALILNSDIADGGVVFAVIAATITWSFVGAGLVAWKARPASRIGPLMIAVGFAWVINALTGANDPWVFITGILFSNVWIVLLYQLLLTFPEGRLQTKAEWRLAVAAWVSGVVLPIPQLLFQPLPDPDFCDGCPSNPILVSDNTALSHGFFYLDVVVAVAALVGLLILLVRRWRGTSRARRGGFLPLLWAGGITMALIALQLFSAAVIDRDVSNAIFILVLLPFLSVPYAFLLGLLRMQMSREAAVAELLDGLRELPVRGGALRDLLADALGDPTLELGFWLPEESRWIGEGGEPLDVDERRDRLASIVERDGRRIAVLLCDPALTDQRRLIDAVGAAAALALENERLEAALRARVEELRSSRARIVQAADAERQRLERDLHDGAQQRLVALALDLRMARDRLPDDPEAGAAMLDAALADLEAATGELRELARGIHPAVLSDRGLRAAVEALAGRAAVPVELGELPEERLPADVEAAAYFVIAEALTNVARYAGADGAAVDVRRRNGALEVSVSDDGVGGADPGQGSGLRGLSDRVAALDGRLEVSSPAGGGTAIKAVIPCAS